MSAIQQLLSKLPQVRKSGSGWIARCPAHQDRDPSLHVAVGDDGRVLVRCHAGCTTEQVVAALGMEMRDLFQERREPSVEPSARQTPPPGSTFTWKAEAVRCAAALSEEACETLALELGVTGQSLRAVGVGLASQTDLRQWRAGGQGWAEDYPEHAFTFPERNAQGQVVGLLLRAPGGRKGFPAGASRGVVVPTTLANGHDPVLVVEGPTDVAALLVLGITSVGRPNNSGGAAIVAGLLQGRKILVVGENDQKEDGSWPGRDGARSVAREIAKSWRRAIEWTLLPYGYKDARAWLQAQILAGLDVNDPGATAEAGRKLLALLSERVCTESSKGSHAKPRRRPVTVCMADVQATEVRWVWKPRIPQGKLTVLAGPQDLGKSTVLADIAARITRGGPWPNGEEGITEPGSVILLNAEDGLEDTVRPRLDAAGAAVLKVFVLQATCDEESGEENWISLRDDIEILEETIRAHADCKAVIIDPISAYLGNTDSYKESDVRRLLGPLAKLAERTGVAIVALMHLNRRSGAKALDRINGSGAFTAAARATWFINQDKGDPALRLFLRGKGNLTPVHTGLAYRIVSAGVVGRVEWQNTTVSTTADEAFEQDEKPPAPSQLDAAMAWLRELLADGPIPQKEVEAAVRGEPFSWATVRRAKEVLGVVARRREGRWCWVLDDQPQPPRGDGPSRDDEHLEQDEHLEEDGRCAGRGRGWNSTQGAQTQDAHEHVEDAHALRDVGPSTSSALQDAHEQDGVGTQNLAWRPHQGQDAQGAQDAHAPDARAREPAPEVAGAQQLIGDVPGHSLPGAQQAVLFEEPAAFHDDGTEVGRGA